MVATPLILYPICLIASLLGGISNGVTGFGLAVMFLMIWSISSLFSYPYTENLIFPVTLQTILAPIIDLVLVYLVGKYHIISTSKLSIVITIGMSIGWPIGMYGLVILPVEILKLTLGVFFLVFVIWRGRDIYSEYNELLKKEKLPVEDGMKTVEIEEIEEFNQISKNIKIDIELNSIIMDNNGLIVINDNSNIKRKSITIVANVEKPISNNNEESITTNNTDTLHHQKRRLSVEFEPPLIIEPEVIELASIAEDLTFGDKQTIFWGVPIRNFTRYEYVLTIFASLVAGLIGGAFGANGPPLMALFTILPVDKWEIRAIVSVSSLAVVPLRFYLVSEFDLFNKDDWLIYIVVNVATIAGLYIGNILVSKVNTKVVLIGLMSLLLISSVSNINLQNNVANTVTLLLSIAFVVVIWIRYLKDWLRLFAHQ